MAECWGDKILSQVKGIRTKKMAGSLGNRAVGGAFRLPIPGYALKALMAQKSLGRSLTKSLKEMQKKRLSFI